MDTVWIAELERKQDEARKELQRATARLAGITAQLQAARGMIADAGELVDLPRTDAIVSVLRSAADPMSRSDVRQALEAGGREGEDDKTVGATLSYLEKAGRVQRLGRGQYTAA